ncbi:MAG: manganese-dependent inorganic pyrophosphatase, partial [Psittacicella sp.]
MIYTIGHKNPDTDAISSAIILADLLTQRGFEAVACKQGPLSHETQYVLGLTEFKEPETITQSSGKDVFLVDHSDKMQSPDDLDEANLLGIIDHHRLGDIMTKNQLEAWIWPVGCTTTVLYNMYKIEGHKISKDIATLMICAILSDTVGFLSPTLTEKDTLAVNELKDIAKISDLDDFIKKLLVEKTDISGLSSDELLGRDLKAYNLNGNNLIVSQIELASLSQVDHLIDDLNKALESRVQKDNLKLAVLMLTDITSSKTVLLYSGELSSKLDPFKTDGNLVLENTLSRKKQGWPWIQ